MPSDNNSHLVNWKDIYVCVTRYIYTNSKELIHNDKLINSLPGFPGRFLFFLIFWGCWGEMIVVTTWLSPPILVPQETVASSDKELELDITEGNIAFEEKLQVGGKKKEKKSKIRYSNVSVCLFVPNRSYVFITMVSWSLLFAPCWAKKCKILARDTTNNYMQNLASEQVAGTQRQRKTSFTLW